MTDNLLTEEIPEKFRNPQTGDVQIDALLRSYRELEQRLSQGPAAPKTPDDYCIDCSHGLFEPDADINRRLHARGMTQEQAQEVYNLAVEKMVPMIAHVAGDFRADREIEKLIAHFGGADQWREVSRQLLAFGQKNLPADVLDSLSSSFEGVLALERMMKSEEPGLKKAPAVLDSAGEQELRSMMRNPRYWRERDPAYIAKVTEGFRKLYGGK